jgi:urea transport system ATP-binding protein
LSAITRERSTLVVEHDMEFVRQFASTVTVLHAGRVLSEGPIEQIQADPRVVEVYLGRERLHERNAA